MHAKQMQALDAIPEIAGEFAQRVRPRLRRAASARYRTEDAETVVVALGSVLGTIEDVVDELRDAGRADRRARRSSASGPGRSTRCARRSRGAKRVVVLEKAFAVGAGGIVGQNVRLALVGPADRRVYDVVAGLGGRPITKALAARAVRRRARRTGSSRAAPSSTWTAELVERELARPSATRRPGPHAENMLRDIGIVAARPH